MKCFCIKFECAILLNNKEADSFTVNSGVRQGCIIPPILFLIAIDWVVRKITDSKRGITWSFFTTLEDLDFADDIALLSSRRSDMQEKTERLGHFASQLGLQLNDNKTEETRFNVKSSNKLKLDVKDFKQVDKFIYSGSVVSIEDSTQKTSKTDYQYGYDWT